MTDHKLPFFVTSHLRYALRPYQRAAVERFVQHWEGEERLSALLFQMATGSGKTLIMAALMLYLYARGYRYFLFFVNSTAILDKTRDNFLNAGATKFLFQLPIQYQGQRVHLNSVTHFDDGHPDDINILFTTVQGLHAKLQVARENSMTLEDMGQQKIVLLSDEAHHLNARTKAKQPAAISWEQSVQRVLEAHPENVLLEFTATIDWSNAAIQEKYASRLLFDYSLKQFRQEGYSKEVRLLQADLPPFERALQAMLLSQYRKKVFERHGIIVKPVVLFKSKTIKASVDFFELFQQRLKELEATDLMQIKEQATTPILKQLFGQLEQFGISLADFIEELKTDFASDKCLIVNSQSDSEAQQLHLNRLEDTNNPYRAIFAVDKLNEGWDVLNLFDIVRLYDTKVNQKKPSRTTLSEAQLIGRGARYFPFQLSEEQVRYQRKFDDEPNHPLRIGEELYYHAAHNPAYLSELGTVLQNIGLQARQDEAKQAHSTNKKRSGTAVALPSKIVVELKTGRSEVIDAFEEIAAREAQKEIHQFQLQALDRRILFKAIQQLPNYRFDRLQLIFPDLKSTSELLERWQAITIEVHSDAEKRSQWTPTKQLTVARSALEQLIALF